MVVVTLYNLEQHREVGKTHPISTLLPLMKMRALPQMMLLTEHSKWIHCLMTMMRPMHGTVKITLLCKGYLPFSDIKTTSPVMQG